MVSIHQHVLGMRYRCTHLSGMLIVAETVATRLLKDSFITGHHVYKTIWTPFPTETLSVETEEDNQYDNFNATVKQRCVFLGVAISNVWLGRLGMGQAFIQRLGRLFQIQWALLGGYLKLGAYLGEAILYLLTTTPTNHTYTF